MENHAALQEIEIACPEGDNLNGDATLATIDAALRTSVEQLERAIQDWLKQWQYDDQETDQGFFP